MQEEITNLIRGAMDVVDVRVELDGNRALINVVSPAFEGMSRVQSHQLVYGCIDQLIADGRLHAVTIRSSTPA
ncbi:MAG: BolA/IbaG family iron-sulfur metabolism protein [Pseudomonadales bacterium]|jgi:acid stress-induced BolA-like protein IbaG/YrbA|nr:BolA/IbaG family iron-sulfur metabolism protein [Pseudomonadales bacterium]MDP6470856.1 BolA/IbaG family iron-sulfur metabolism protein [Pseudomonadales bacterium]MDP6825959.1 BolA/IbaG family iron-sulfur metabolism protein [Pseudomonadales bacterium]MDP6972271.1 BolA/IbaG family iron-sulfur metabolism protein [Pseudomonadales bacterium]|tara:strand:+ start:2692 stop:2910 length:219 start_codon:yes stop_codon:yes gene_type:complete